jgi:hypothetical protein
MGCGSSKPHRKDQHYTSSKYHHHGYPVDKKTQKKYRKAYFKQAKRDRRKKYAAVNASVANSAFVGYVLCRNERKIPLEDNG